MEALERLQKSITGCRECPRLRDHCEQVAKEKRRAYLGDTYWGKPISGFGDPKARLWIVGLAPAAHGANRTGRIFTGDRSGDWLYRALHRFGFANQPTSTHREDGLSLRDTFISCVVRCAPPGNKPEPDEIRRCSVYLRDELTNLMNVKVYLVLGQIALKGLWPHLIASRSDGNVKNPLPRFSHGGMVPLPGGKTLLMSYHPSQQNTFTGRLTEAMFDRIFQAAQNLLGKRPTD